MSTVNARCNAGAVTLSACGATAGAVAAAIGGASLVTIMSAR